MYEVCLQHEALFIQRQVGYIIIYITQTQYT